jgi:peroxiredoxin Q/BCP
MKPLRYILMFSALLSFFAKLGAEPLKVGDAAPVISAKADDGSTINLGDVYKANNYTLVWFYPKALTGGCTKQGCSLRDANAELTKKGVAVIGVSTDTVEKQKEFKDVNHFPYPLLADTDKAVIKAFGQNGAGPMAAREAYLIDKSGKVVYHDEKQTDKQAENVLNFLNAK